MTALQIAALREQFIRDRTDLLNKRVSAAEKKLLDVIISRVIDDLEKDNGSIKPSITNIEIVSRIDKVYSDFQKNEYVLVIRQFAGDLGELQNLNDSYFKIIESDQKKIEKVSKEVRGIMQKRIGIKPDGNLTKDGYLDRMIKDTALLNKVKKETYKSVTNGVPMKEFLKRINTTIVGTENTSGGLQKHFNTFARDVYAQYDRTNQVLFANKLGLNAFIYAGGLIKSSRKFCIDNNGKVFTNEEAKKWKGMIGDEDGPVWSDTLGDYQPLEDCGGINCRHSPNYISNSEAIRRRSELANVLN